ncbi:MAG: glycosyltransferase family 2 protein [Xanthobacteraceae bacterium]|nr:glycosyltransferase family 2 protein [Xanthobacteraceae bacterium]
MLNKNIAVVIGFRDWGLDRLSLALKRLSGSSLGSALDIVVSDYGSENEEEVRSAVEAAGGRVTRTARNGPWSRSRALNAGVLATSAKFVITTDADMIFTQDAVNRILQMMQTDENTVHLVQCRDLNEAFGIETASGASDEVLEKNSHFRPRWGMGGLIAFQRSDFDVLGGYDARMEIYGGEDIDFAQRLSRCGRRLNWIDDPAVRIFHIWHPNTRDTVQRDPSQLAAQQRNRDIMLNDQTWLRNLNIGGRAKPAVSVLIASHNRAGYLMDSVNSVLGQTVQDFELVIMDDGSTDHTRDVLSSIDDPRVRWSTHDNRGVAYTRNRLVAEARSSLIIVHDDDDIMLPWRIEVQLDALRSDLAGTYGGWVDFDNETGKTEVVPGKEYSSEAFMYTGKILAHGTSMFRTEILRRYAYREHLRSGVDFNLIVRLANAGFKFQHTGHLHILRRMHGMNLTTTTEAHQKKAATRTVALLRRRNSIADEVGLRATARTLPESNVANLNDLENEVLIYLPDHLAQRQVNFTASLEEYTHLHNLFPDRLQQGAGWLDSLGSRIPNVTHSELARLRQIDGLKYFVSRLEEDNVTDDDLNPTSRIIQALPSSGLLSASDINRVHIQAVSFESISPQVVNEATGKDASVASRMRYWSAGKSIYVVVVEDCSELNNAVRGISQDDDDSTILLFFPESLNHKIDSGR